MKDGTTHLTHKAEHAVDLESGVIVAAEIRSSRFGRYRDVAGDFGSRGGGCRESHPGSKIEQTPNYSAINPDMMASLQLQRGSTRITMYTCRFRPALRNAALNQISTYTALSSRVIPYNTVHNAMGGQMPNPDTSPSDPIFCPFHAFLVAV